MRIIDTYTYTKDEMETICRYDYIDNCWYVETNVKKHMTKIMNKYENHKVISVNTDGNPSKISAKLGEKQVSFRN